MGGTAGALHLAPDNLGLTFHLGRVLFGISTFLQWGIPIKPGQAGAWSLPVLKIQSDSTFMVST